MVANTISQIGKKRILIGLWSIVAIGWVAMGVAIALAVSKPYLVAAVTFAAVSTEGAFWLTSLILGIALIDARKAITKKITDYFKTVK